MPGELTDPTPIAQNWPRVHRITADTVPTMTRVLVTGTDQAIGASLLARLVRHDLIPVAAVGDGTGPVLAFDGAAVRDHAIAVDLDTHSSIEAALNDIDVLVHSRDVRPGQTASITDSVKAMASACADTDTHFVMVSRVGADLSSLDHRKQLWQAEQIIEDTPGLGFTIQRVTHPHAALKSLMQGLWLPLPAATPVQPVSPNDIAGRVVGLIKVGPSQRVRDFGGPELMSFREASNIMRQVTGSLPRSIPLPRVGVLAEARDGVHVTRSGDRGSESFRNWLEAHKND